MNERREAAIGEMPGRMPDLLQEIKKLTTQEARQRRKVLRDEKSQGKQELERRKETMRRAREARKADEESRRGQNATGQFGLHGSGKIRYLLLRGE
jgi:hypothetical protein